MDKPVALPARMIPRNGYNELDSSWAHGWNACLDEIAKLGPLYSRPVQGERYTGELKKLRADSAALAGTVEGLRAQLAERDALLNRMAYYLSPALTSHQQWMSKETLHDALSALHEWRKLQGCSVSAEPVGDVWVYRCERCHKTHKGLNCAPVERDERAAFEAWFAGTGLAEAWGRTVQECLKGKGCCTSSRWEAWQARAALERKP